MSLDRSQDNENDVLANAKKVRSKSYKNRWIYILALAVFGLPIYMSGMHDGWPLLFLLTLFVQIIYPSVVGWYFAVLPLVFYMLAGTYYALRGVIFYQMWEDDLSGLIMGTIMLTAFALTLVPTLRRFPHAAVLKSLWNQKLSGLLNA